MKRRFPPFLALATTLSIFAAPASGQSIVGKARIVSGDEIEVDRQRIRLFGITAPRPGQTCTAKGKPWACGQNATFALSAIVERQWVHCRPRAAGADGPIVAVCRLAGNNGPDIGAAMVRQGWALADRQRSEAYIAEENQARKARAGIWVGEIAPPR